MQERYMISDAAKMVEVENHVLRYWEEELNLRIPRNEKKQRYYRPSDIKLLRTIKDLKEQGFQLKAIKMILPDIGKIEHMDPQGVYKLREELNRQVQQEEMKASVTSLSEVRAEREQKMMTGMRQPSYLEQSQAAALIHRQETRPDREPDNDREARQKLQQFEQMLRQMIRETMEEMSRETEKRICDEVTTRLQKQVNYLIMQKEELQEKQMALLEQILQAVKDDLPQAAASREELPGGKDQEGRLESRSDRKSGKEKRKKRKIFAKFS